jgi:hypothetical protein
MTRETVLARTMVELADNLVDDFDVSNCSPRSPTAASRCSTSTESCSAAPTVTST